MLKKRYIILLFLIALPLFVVARLPLSSAIALAGLELPQQITLHQVSGSIWQGSLRFSLDQPEQSRQMRLHSKLNALSLLLLKPQLTWQLQSDDGSDLSCQTAFALLSSRIYFDHCHGSVTNTLLNDLLREQNVVTSQGLDINAIELHVDMKQQQFNQASGVLSWQGGETQIPDPRGNAVRYDLKPMEITLETDNNVLLAPLRVPNGMALGEIRVDLSEMASIKVQKALLDYQELPYPGNAPANKVVFETGYLLNAR